MNVQDSPGLLVPTPSHTPAPPRSGRARRPWVGLGIALVCLALGASTQAQAPALSSVVPATGTTGVAVTTTLTFQFSVPMDRTVPILGSVPGVFTGNFEVGPEDVSSHFSCDWSGDGRTLTCEGSGDLPDDTLVSWKLNPAGSFFPIKSAAGAALAQTTGSFRTGTGSGGGDPGGGDGDAPTLVSSNPASGASGVPVTGNVVFVFSLPMQPNPQLGGVPPFVKGAIAWTGAEATKFSYAWSADGKTLTCEYAGDLPGTTQIGWTLNPAGALFSIQSEDEVPLASVSGNFTTGAGSGTGGNDGCDPDGVPDTWGGYGITKSFDYVQDSADAPHPAAERPFAFGALVSSPDTGPIVTAASLSVAGAAPVNLSGLPIGGIWFLSRELATEALLNSTYPGGAYVLRFQSTGQPERVVSLNMPATTPPTPHLANFAETRNFDPDQDFTLRWDAFSGAVAGDSIHLSLMTGTNVVFQAPDPCVPRTLAVSATSITIPAKTFEKGKVYQGSLAFQRQFHMDTNSIPGMAGFAAISKTTEFTISLGGGGSATAPRFVSWEILPGTGLKLTLTGSPLTMYTVQRGTSVAGGPWNQVGVVMTDLAGTGLLIDPQVDQGGPWFYRAVGN